MRTITIKDVQVEERQRKNMAPKELDELKKSIVKEGLIHAPVMTFKPDPTLVAGERRMTAMQQLHEAGLDFFYDGEKVPLWEMPYTTTKDTDLATLQEIEFAENMFRVQLSWQDECTARKRIHDLRKESNPTQSVVQTAKEIVTKSTGLDPESPAGVTAVRQERREIAKAMIVAEHLDDPMVQRARDQNEAYKIILDKVENKVKAKNVLAAIQTRQSHDHQIIHGDCLKELKKLPSGQIDTIICDPPYGMKADKMGKGEFHMYDDSPETALEVCRAIISEGFRVTKPKAILFMFCDIDHFITLRTYAAQQAWSVWRQPIVWRKGTDGHSPWGRAGFVRTTELLLFAVKGQKELVYPGGPDVLDFKRPGRAERVHSAEKPVALLEHLIHLSTLPGMTILDPTAGSGPIISAAIKKSCKVITIEKDEQSYEQCLQRLSGAYDEPGPDENEGDGGEDASSILFST